MTIIKKCLTYNFLNTADDFTLASETKCNVLNLSSRHITSILIWNLNRVSKYFDGIFTVSIERKYRNTDFEYISLDHRVAPYILGASGCRNK